VEFTVPYYSQSLLLAD